MFRFRFNPSTAGVTHTHQTHSPHALVEKKNSFFHFFFIFRPLGSRRKEQTLGPRSLKHHSSNQQWRPFLFLVCVSFSLHKLVVFPWLKLIRNSKTFLSLSDFTHVDDLKFTFSDAKTLEVRWRASASTGEKKHTHYEPHETFSFAGGKWNGRATRSSCTVDVRLETEGRTGKAGENQASGPFLSLPPPLKPTGKKQRAFPKWPRTASLCPPSNPIQSASCLRAVLSKHVDRFLFFSFSFAGVDETKKFKQEFKPKKKKKIHFS